MVKAVLIRWWRPGLLFLFCFGSLGALLALQPFGQDPRYHQFADRRSWLGIPNFLDVTSNIPFLLVGLAGLRVCRRDHFSGSALAWSIFFAGVVLVSVGSAYYHWQPRNDTLVWDRLPITVAFMAMFVALLGEALGERFGRLLLAPALLVGFSSVIYWHWSDDLRLYVWVQFMPLLAVPVLLLLFRSPYPRQWLLLPALGCYLLAKVAEILDSEIFAFASGVVGGHALKHLLATTACFVVMEMLDSREKGDPRR